MNIKKYEAFVRAVELGSLSKAAEELGYTQSGISHMMQSLEDEVGFPLLVRTSSGILPNTEGETLLPIIRQLLSTNETLEQYIAKIKGVDTGRIRIASFPSVATYWLPTIISRFQKDFPNVEIVIREDRADLIEAMMASREVDFCIYTGGQDRSFEWMPLYRDQMMVILPPGHPLEHSETVQLETLVSEQFILPLKGYDYEVYQILDKLPRYPHIRFTACSDYAIISMVAAGLGVSIMPELLLRGRHDNVVIKELVPPSKRTIGLAIGETSSQSPATRKFADYIIKWVSVAH